MAGTSIRRPAFFALSRATTTTHLHTVARMNMIQLRNLAMVLLGASNVRLLSRGEIEARKKTPPPATDPRKVVVVPQRDLDAPAETGAGEP